MSCRDNAFALQEKLVEENLREFIGHYYSGCDIASKYNSTELRNALREHIRSLGNDSDHCNLLENLKSYIGLKSTKTMNNQAETIEMQDFNSLEDRYQKAMRVDDLDECFRIFEEFVKSLSGTTKKNAEDLLNSSIQRHSRILQAKNIGVESADNYHRERTNILLTLSNFIRDH
jgi:hypothetical protein